MPKKREGRDEQRIFENCTEDCRRHERCKGTARHATQRDPDVVFGEVGRIRSLARQRRMAKKTSSEQQEQMSRQQTNIYNRVAYWTDSQNRKNRKSTRLNSSHSQISYAVFCLKKKNISSHEL